MNMQFHLLFIHNFINISKSLVLLINNCPIFLLHNIMNMFFFVDIFLYIKFNESYKNLIRLNEFIIKQIQKNGFLYIRLSHVYMSDIVLFI